VEVKITVNFKTPISEMKSTLVVKRICKSRYNLITIAYEDTHLSDVTYSGRKKCHVII